MDRTARVHAIEAVDAMATALRQFGEELAAALDNLQSEIRRSIEWIDIDRRKYWEHEVERSWNRLSEARCELQRAQTFLRVSGQTPACRDERKAVERAKMRLETSLEKVETVRQWAHSVQHGALELSGSVRQLADWVQADLPRALAVLQRMSQALEAYAAKGGPAGTEVPPPLAGLIRPADSAEKPENASDEKLGSDEPSRPDQAGG